MKVVIRTVSISCSNEDTVATHVRTYICTGSRTFLLNKLDSQTAKLPYIVNAYPQQHPIESSLGKLLPMPWTLAHIRACQSLPCN